MRGDKVVEETAQEVVDLTVLKEQVASPRKRHLPTRSKDKLVNLRNFLSISPDPPAGASPTYSTSENSFAGTHSESRGNIPASPRAAFRDQDKARRTPSHRQSPNIMSFKPQVSRSGTFSSGMHTIKPLRIQERGHGLSDDDPYTRDRESRAQKPAKSYGWI